MRRLPVLAGLGVSLVLVLLLVPLPASGRLGHALQDAAHLPVGALLALWVQRLLARRSVGSEGATALAALGIVAGGLLVVEVVQPLVGREFALRDWYVGVGGAASALLLGAAFAGPAWRRWACGVSGLAVLAAAGAAGTTDLYDTLRQQRDFPLLASFEDGLELERWAFEGVSAAPPAPGHATHGEAALPLTFHVAEYPGATLRWPPPDWRGHATLAFDVHLRGEMPYDLIVKVTDADHDGTYADRFHLRVTLHPGPNAIRVPLADVEDAPAKRKLDVGCVSALQFFAHAPQAEAILVFDHVRLERDAP